MTQQTISKIEERIEEIESDSRMPDDYPDDGANVHVNAPLAMIQVGFHSELRVLRWVLSSLESEEEEVVNVGSL